MKPALIILTVAVSLALTGLFAHSVYQRHIAIEQSSELVMAVTTEVLVNWDPQTIRQHAAEDLLATESADTTLRRYTPMSRRLGDLQEIYDIQYDVNMPAWWQPDGAVSASYSMRARFEAEVATIRVELVRQQGRWLISVYNIQPPAIAA